MEGYLTTNDRQKSKLTADVTPVGSAESLGALDLSSPLMLPLPKVQLINKADTREDK
jgi:hypothetical protein